jgi:hypothetical protein
MRLDRFEHKERNMRLPICLALGVVTTSLVLLMATAIHAQSPATSRPLATNPAAATKPVAKKVSPALREQSKTATRPTKIKRADPCDGGEVSRARRPNTLMRQ